MFSAKVKFKVCPGDTCVSFTRFLEPSTNYVTSSKNFRD